MGGLLKFWYALLFILIAGLVVYDTIWSRWYDEQKIGEETESELFGEIVNISQDYFYFSVGSSVLRIESESISELMEKRLFMQGTGKMELLKVLITITMIIIMQSI